MKLKINAFIALVMMLTLPTVQAHAATVSADAAIQQLNFALTVQWDQKDMAFRTKAINTFLGQVVEMQRNGVSKDQIVAAVKAQMPDAQTAKDIETLAQTAKQNHLSDEATSQLVAQYLSKAHTSGASWSDSATIAVVTGGILVLVAVVILTGGTVNVSSGYYYNSCYYNCYDYYGNVYCC